MVANYVDATNLSFVKYFLHSYIPVYLQHFVVQPVYYHTYCPATSDSWCQYQRDQVNGTNLFKPGKGFDPEVIIHVKPEYIK